MSERPPNERIAALETEVRLLREDQCRVLEKLDAISFKLNSHIPCPDPGSCVRLAGELGTIRSKIEILEADRNQRKGERGIIAIVCTIVGALVSFLANLIFKP